MNQLDIAKDVIEDLRETLTQKYVIKYKRAVASDKEIRSDMMMFTIEELYDLLDDEMEAYEESFTEGEKVI